MDRQPSQKPKKEKNVFSIFICFGWHPPAISMKPDDIAGCLWLRDASRFCSTAATNSMDNRSPQWVFVVVPNSIRCMEAHASRPQTPPKKLMNQIEWNEQRKYTMRKSRCDGRRRRWRQRTQLLKNSLILLVGATVEKDPFHLYASFLLQSVVHAERTQF